MREFHFERFEGKPLKVGEASTGSTKLAPLDAGGLGTVCDPLLVQHYGGLKHTVS